MKTTVSIPDKVFNAGERLAKRLGLSRSELYARALSEYTGKHGYEGVTGKLNALFEEEPSGMDDNLKTMQLRAMPDEDWS